MTVRGWDRDSLAVTGVREPGPGRFFHRVDGAAAKLGFEAPDSIAAFVRADLEVRVPRATSLWIRVAGAEVEIRGVTGAVDIHTVTGPVSIGDSPSMVDVESVAGRVSLDLVRSEVVRASAGAGGVEFHGLVDDLTLSAVEGSIVVEGPTKPRRVALESIDGPIRYAGGVAPGGVVSVDTHRGNVDLRLDADVSATLDVATVEGRIETEFDLRLTRGLSFPGTRKTAELGTGAGEIVVRSYGGNVSVRRRAGS